MCYDMVVITCRVRQAADYISFGSHGYVHVEFVQCGGEPGLTSPGRRCPVGPSAPRVASLVVSVDSTELSSLTREQLHLNGGVCNASVQATMGGGRPSYECM